MFPRALQDCVTHSTSSSLFSTPRNIGTNPFSTQGSRTVSVKFNKCSELKILQTQFPYGPRRQKTCLRGFVKQQRRRPACASMQSDQWSAPLLFAQWILDSIISKLATDEISIFYLVSVTEHAGFGMTWSETPKTGFSPCSPYLT